MLAARACRPVLPAPKRVAAVHCATGAKVQTLNLLRRISGACVDGAARKGQGRPPKWMSSKQLRSQNSSN